MFLFRRSSSPPLYKRKHEIVWMNIQEWIDGVTAKSDVVYPHCIAKLLLQNVKQNGDNAQIPVCQRFGCASLSPYREPDAKCIDLALGELKRELNKYTFVMVNFSTIVNNMSFTHNEFISNHTMPVFLHRASTEEPWSISLCDPNWSLFWRGSKLEEELHATGYYIRQALRSHQALGGTVNVRRCLNVNACLPWRETGLGVCYAGMCATLNATRAWASLHPEQKASNGDELMNLIREATHAARPVATEVMKAMYKSNPHEKTVALLSSPGIHKNRNRERSPSQFQPSWYPPKRKTSPEGTCRHCSKRRRRVVES